MPLRGALHFRAAPHTSVEHTGLRYNALSKQERLGN